MTLDRISIRMSTGLTWNAARVRAYSYQNLPALDRTDDKPSEMLTLNEAASILGVCTMTVRRLIGRGILPAVQAAQGSKDYPSLTRSLFPASQDRMSYPF